MKVYINNIPIIMTSLDSNKSIKSKIALKLNTLPKYIHFIDGFPESFNENDKHDVEDILKTIKDYVGNESNFTYDGSYFLTLYELVISKFSENVDVKKDIIRPFLLFNTKLLKNIEEIERVSGTDQLNFFMEQELNGFFEALTSLGVPFSKEEIIDIMINHKENLKNFENEIKKASKKEGKNEKLTNNLSTVKEIDHTDFQLEENVLEIKLNIPTNFSSLDIFNLMELNTGVQFVSCNGFYKIFGDFIPPEHFLTNLKDDSIVLFISKTKIVKRKEKEVVVVEESDEQENDDETDDEEKVVVKNRNELRKEERDRRNKEKIYNSAYVKVIITKEFHVIFDFDVNGISKTDLFNIFFNLFPKDEIEILEEKCSLIRGSYDYPNKNLNKTVLCDLIMTNPMFSEFIVINESIGIPVSKTTLRFNHPSTGEIVASVTEQKNDKYKNLEKDEDDEYFVENSYIKIHITKCKNLESVSKFQEILSKLLRIYYEEFKNISKIYQLYIKNFQDSTKKTKKQFEKKETGKMTKQLEIMEPKIFTKGKYIRNICQSYPLNIDKDYENYQEGKDSSPTNLYKKALDEQTDILIFPKKEMNGFKPRRYICNTEINIKKGKQYPGMTVNKLPNNKIFSHLPCCFKLRQNTKKKLKTLEKKSPSVFNLFKFEQEDEGKEEDEDEEEYEEEEKEDEDVVESETASYIENKSLKKIKNEIVKQQQDKIITNKFVKENCSGVLPPKLNLLFENINNKDGYSFHRFGVKRSPNSFIDCIQTIDRLSKDTDDDFWLYTEDLRSQIISKYAVLAKQENYETSLKFIEKDIKKVNSYFNPLQYVTILEKIYNYNIFLFVRDDDEYLTLPFHKEGYYKKENTNKCVFIYVHSGSESDAADYPQCEIIALSNDKKAEDNQCEFEYDSEMAQKILELFKKLDNVHYLSIEDANIINGLDIESQYVDNKGKTRGVNVVVNSSKFSLLFKEPLPILNVPIDNKIHLINENDVQSIGLTGLKYFRTNEFYEFHGKLGNLESIVLCRSDRDISFSREISSFDSLTVNVMGRNDESQLEQYKENKKLARYLLEYFFWLYSHFIQDKIEENPLIDIENYNKILMDEFISEYITIDQNISYKRLSNFFSFENRDILRNRKMILNSQELLKRLIYYLRLEITRNFPNILNYKENTFLKTFYFDVEDFTEFPNQIVLKDKDVSMKWLGEKEELLKLNKYLVYDSIYPSLIHPYFYTNKLIGGEKVFLAQNTNSFAKATKIGVDWVKEKYNVGYLQEFEVEDFEYFNCKIYSYENLQEIKSYVLNMDKENAYNIRILGYKFDNENYFTTLLKI